MNRRAALQAIAGAFAAPLIIHSDDTKPLIQGVGILRYPCRNSEEDKRCRDIAGGLAKHIRQGTIIGFPNTVDYMGNYEWDFKIEGGDPSQVEIRRNNA